MKHLGLAAAIMILIAGANLRSVHPLNHDVSWLFVAAERMLDGGKFGDDIYELNAPGAVLLYVPAAMLARAAAVSPKSAVLALSVAIAALCLTVAKYFVCLTLGPNERWRSDATLISWALIWTLLPGYDFAQREYFIALLLIPFALMEACRLTQLTVLERWEISASLLAALAMMIKPYFALVPAALLVPRILLQGPLAVLKSADFQVLCMSGIAYIVIVFVAFPSWLDVAKHAFLLYGAYDGSATWVLRLGHSALPPTLIQIGVFLGLLLSLHPVMRRVSQQSAVATLYLLGTVLVCGFLYLLQWKGFTYHLLPLTLIAMSTACLAIISILPAVIPGYTLASSHVLGVILVAVLVRLSVYLAPPGPPVNQRLAAALSKRAQAGPVYAFTTGMRPMFPIVTEIPLDWSPRYPHLWPLVGIAYQQQVGGAKASLSSHELDDLRRELIGQVKKDFIKSKPATVVIDVSPRKQWVRGQLDFLAIFLSDPGFSQMWQQYERVDSVGDYAIYALRSTPSAPRDEPPSGRSR